MQYRAKKACTLPGSHRYVEAGEVVELSLPKGQKPPKHLEPIKPKAEPPKQAAGTGQDPGPDHSRPEDLDK